MRPLLIAIQSDNMGETSSDLWAFYLRQKLSLIHISGRFGCGCGPVGGVVFAGACMGEGCGNAVGQLKAQKRTRDGGRVKRDGRLRTEDGQRKTGN